MKRLKFLYLKEIIDILRDRRTIISMIVIPVVVFPALMYFASFIMIRSAKKMEAQIFSVSVESSLWNDTLKQKFVEAKLKPFKSDNPKDDVLSKGAEVGVVYDDTARVVMVLYDATDKESREAKERASRALSEYKNLLLSMKLKQLNIEESSLRIFSVKERNIAPPKRMGGFLLGTILGYILVLLIFSSSMYPAVDLTAGEKERRTIELLLSAPATRSEIVTAKLLAVMSVAFVTSFIYISSYAISFVLLKSQFLATSPELSKAFAMPLDIKTVCLFLLIVLPMAAFASSLELAIASFARSYKEAQSYLSPLMIIVIFPAISGFLMESSEKLTTYIIPIFNTVQIIKQMFVGEFDLFRYALTFFSNIAYAFFAIFYAKKLYQKESVLIRE